MLLGETWDQIKGDAALRSTFRVVRVVSEFELSGRLSFPVAR